MEVARKCLWAMGYDLRFKAVKVGKLYDALVITNREAELKMVKKILGSKENWTPLKMWEFMEFDSLPDMEDF